MPKAPTDLIAAIATPSGKGGVGIVRISGENLSHLAAGILASGKLPPPRHAVYQNIIDGHGDIIDNGICLYFNAPHSFTGQEVLELQGHGGNAVLHRVLARCLVLGARPAIAGEFTLRAYLNNKLDLAQAEALADLINANTDSAARAAANSLSGAFSQHAHTLAQSILSLRADIEASIDFADEDIAHNSDFLSRIEQITKQARHFLSQCRQGARLTHGITALIAGEPNVGKSSLLNLLCADRAAIVADTAGTTRDLISRELEIHGIPVRLIDTAGIHDSADNIEQEGISRALAMAELADIILWVSDSDAAIPHQLKTSATVLQVQNKIDIRPHLSRHDNVIYISAKTGEGCENLQTAITGHIDTTISPYTARTRHIAALEKGCEYLQNACCDAAQIELAMAWLTSAHESLMSLTGNIDNEKLLGEIFSRFCIGK